MSPIDDDLLREFSAIFLEILVPFEVQRRIPGVREHWQIVLDSKGGKAALAAIFSRALRERRSVAETIRQGIAGGDRDVLLLKNTLYGRIGRDQALISSFFVRPITNGNEQCPYWNQFDYQRPPKAPTKALSEVA